MKYLQKTLSAILALAMLLQCGLAGAVKASAEEAEVSVTTGMLYTSEADVTNEEAFAGYALQLFYGSDMSFFGSAAGETLTGDEKILYDALVPFIRQIANGERASAAIAVGKTATVGGDTYVADAEAEFSGTTFTGEMLNRVMDALLADLPYEMYWYDKVSGCSSYEIGGSKLMQIGMQFTVASDYRGADAYTADTAKTGAAKAAAANAKSIVAQYAAASDYEKLVGYKSEICALVEYDYAAAAAGSFTTDIDPWQLISVFDGDSSTNVVCEGYSKAFMYLCDMTDFDGDVACYTVSGNMDGGAHMWNVVEIDGKHYLADVTNSDTGTVGENGILFLAGAAGTAASSYSVAGISYVYDSDTLSLWGTGADSILTLEASGYDPEAEGEGEIASGTCGENLTWTLVDGVLTISGTGKMDNYGLNEDTGMSTNSPWHNNREGIVSVIIEDGVSSIGASAFEGCTNLKDITIPNSVEIIGRYAFSSCQSLVTLTVPESVSEIEEGAFFFCTGLESILLPSKMTRLGEYAFNYCGRLTNIILPEGITELKVGLFQECNALECLTIPETVQSVAAYLVNACVALKSITFTGDAPIFDRDAFLNNTLIIFYPEDNCTWTDDVMQDYGGTITWAVIGSDVDPGDGEDSGSDEGSGEGTGDGSGSGEGSGGGSGSGSGSGEGSGEGAGGGSGSGEGSGEGSGSGSGSGEGSGEGTGSGSADLDIAEDFAWSLVDGILTISGHGAMPEFAEIGDLSGLPWYDEREAITSVIIVDGITSICRAAFDACYYLRDVTIPETVACIGDYAFNACKSLVSVTIPSRVTEIKENTFSGCSSMISVTLGSSVRHIGNYAFGNTSITELKLPASVSSITGSTFWACKNLSRITVDPGNTALVVSENVLYTQDMRELLLYPAADLRTEYAIPEGVVSLGGSAFGYAANLEKIEIPNTVTDLGYDTFEACVNLREINIPYGVTSLGRSLFERCTSLEEAIIPESVTSIEMNAFYDCSSLKKVVLPGSLTVIGPVAFHGCAFSEIVVPDTVTAIADGAFSGCSNLQSIRIPASVEYIGNVFFDSTALVEISVDENNQEYTSIDGVLYDKNMTCLMKYPACKPGEAYIIPDTVKEIHSGAFQSSSNLKTICFPDGLTCIENSVCIDCRNVTDVIIPESVTRIGDRAFSGCESLQGINIPAGVSKIESAAFNECSSLRDIVIPEGIETIESLVFYGCDSLDCLIIPASVQTINDYAFLHCDNLKEIIFEGDMPTIGYHVFPYINITIRYPAENATWDSDVMQSFGDDIVWNPVCSGEHAEQIMDAVSPTCTQPGLTEGKKCTVCGVVIAEQEVIPATGIHVYENGVCKYCGMEEPPVEDQLEDLVDNNASAEEIRDAVQNMDTEELKSSMEQDSAAVENIAALEQTVGGAAEIAVEDASVGIAENEVSIIGANLNPVDEGKTAKLVIDTAEKTNTIPEAYDSASAVHFSMTLENVENTKQLEVPVKITLPVPKNLDPAQVRVIHYHDGKTDILKPAIHQEGGKHFASIVLTGFSDFALVQNAKEPEVPIKTTPMYRLYNPNSGEHFYTGSLEERDILVAAGWQYEGIAWNAPTNAGSPVYRLYNPNSGDHHYTMSAEERDMLVAVGWQYEGVCWNSATPDNLPLYRLYNPNADCGSHHYTGSTEERDFLVSVGWHYEGIGWFGMLR